MRFESVTVHAFGPFADRTLEFAPGMTVIYGLNESGKSTWHAALYAGLCGIRRTRGQPRTEDREFAERHRPWDCDAWEISIRVQLNDGRRIELRHDLDGRADCRARDLTLGNDVSGQIINEGTPDGALWLGLDRRSFLTTACVQQVDVLGILRDPALLQEHLQRAAATARTDATATEAIARLKEFHANQVGREWVKSRPLRQAQDRVRVAETALDRAQEEHAEFVGLTAQADELRTSAETLKRRLRLLEAASAAREAEQWVKRVRRVQELARRYPNGPPPSLLVDDMLVRKVVAALAAWETRPTPPPLSSGPSVDELRRQIGALPAMPEGDLAPYQNVVAAKKAYEDATRILALHEAGRPNEPTIPEVGGASEQELRNLARDLEVPEPSMDPSLRQRLDRARRHVEALSTRRHAWTLIGLGAMGGLAGLLLIVSGAMLVGLLLLAATGIATALVIARVSIARARAFEELRNTENVLGEQLHATTEIARRREAATDRANALGLPADSINLRALADATAEGQQQKRDFDRWTNSRSDLVERLAAAKEQLGHVLRSRAVEVGDDVVASLEAYLAACDGRSRVAAEAGRRPGLESQLLAREAAEESSRRLRDAERTLREAAADCGIAGEAAENLVRHLKEWQARREAALEEHEKARNEWAELQTLLEGRGLEEIEAEADRKKRAAERLTTEVNVDDIAAMSLEGDIDEQLSRFRDEADRASRQAESVRGQLEERAWRLPSVSEAEEEVARARLELDRILSLGRTLELTLEFLERAQERVHRDIAPVLAQTVKHWLPEITRNRYTDVIVNPETLEVQVCGDGGRWRNAASLSHGTTEQVYLLLRMAMAKHLTKSGETCPLIFDDVTVQSDRERTEALMDCLHTISRDAQVIVFSQEEEVLAWAQARLNPPQDRLVQLDSSDIKA